MRCKCVRVSACALSCATYWGAHFYEICRTSQYFSLQQNLQLLLLLLQIKCKFHALILRILQYYGLNYELYITLHKFHRCDDVTNVLVHPSSCMLYAVVVCCMLYAVCCSCMLCAVCCSCMLYAVCSSCMLYAVCCSCMLCAVCCML